jgi:hypothetical protein
MNRSITILALVALAAGAVHAADSPKVGPVEAIVLPPPKAELPPLPSDGSGLWRLHLEDGYPGSRACRPTPLWVVLHVENGKIVSGAAFPPHQGEGASAEVAIGAWGQVDGSGLSIGKDRMTGRLVVSHYPPWNHGQHDQRVAKRGSEVKFQPYEMKTEPPQTLAIDVAVNGRQGEGTWSLEPKDPRRPSQGAVALRREPLLPLPEQYDLELFMPAAFGESPIIPEVMRPRLWCRVRMGKAGPMKWAGTAFFREGNAAHRVAWTKVELAWDGRRLSGRLHGAPPEKPNEAFSFEIQGERIGRRLFGQVTIRQGDYRKTTPWRGFLDVVSPVLPMEYEEIPAWLWRHDRQADPRLAAAALEESAQPVLPGEPGKKGFWTWRHFVPMGPLGHRLSVIYPPCFDLEETTGAAKYRFEIKRPGSADKTFTFEAGKPWRPLAPVWKEMPPGGWTLTVTALDGAGKPLPGPMRMGVGSKPISDGEYTAPTRAIVEVGSIVFEKRPSFAGPYNTPPRSWTAAALLAAGWDHGYGPMDNYNWFSSKRGLGSSHWMRTGGEGTFQHETVWSELAIRALSDDPWQRLQAEELTRLWFEAFRLHQQSVVEKGFFHYYGGFSPCTHWHAEMMLDTLQQTGDPVWTRQILDYAKALVSLQNPSGTFRYNIKPGKSRQDTKIDPLPGPDKIGYNTYCMGFWQHATQFGPSELLYTLGRIRRDLKTDEFLQAERLAHRWMIEVGVRERFFPLYISHSMSAKWPINQHALSALYFARYLLEMAPADLRDLKLAEEVARWAEDKGVDWRRQEDGNRPQPNVMPRISRGDRGMNAPAEVNLLAAIVFERLGRETGNPLWTAKGEALAAAVLAAQDPRTGLVPCELDTKFNGASAGQAGNAFASGWAVQLLREYAALKEAKK